MAKGTRGANHSNKRRMEFAKLIFEGKSGPQAAEAMGISYETVRDWLERPDVRTAIEAMKARFVAKVTEEGAITREAVLKKYWAFACIDPEKTRYITSSQCQALTCVREMMGWTGPEEGDKKGTHPADVYVPEWMKKQEPSIQ